MRPLLPEPHKQRGVGFAIPAGTIRRIRIQELLQLYREFMAILGYMRILRQTDR